MAKRKPKPIDYTPYIEQAKLVAKALPCRLNDVELAKAIHEAWKTSPIKTWLPYSSGVWQITVMHTYPHKKICPSTNKRPVVVHSPG
jgi:hypothetical protein